MRSDPSGDKIIEKVQLDGEGVDNTPPAEEHHDADGHVDVVDNGVDNDSSMEKDENGGSKDEMKLEDHADIIAESSLDDSKEKTVDVKEQIEQKQIVSPRRRDRLEKLRKKRIDAVNASRNSIWVQTQSKIDEAEVIQPSIETDQTANQEKEEDETPTKTSTDIEQVGKEVDHVTVTNEIEVSVPPVTLQVRLEDSEGPMTMSPSPKNIDNVEKQGAEPGPEEAIAIEKGDEENEGEVTEGGEALKQPEATVSSLDDYIDLSSSSSTSCNDDDDKYSVINSNKSEDLTAIDKDENTKKTEVEFESSVGTSIKRPQWNKTNRQISDERALTNSSSNLTTASQVTTKHGNTTNKGLRNPVSSTNSMASDISSLNPDEGTLGSEEYKREIERLRMRKIKLQSVAVSVGMNNNIEPMETLTEVSKLSSSEHDIVLSDSKKSDELDTATLLTSTQNRSEIDNVPKRGEYNASSAPVESRPCDNGLERLIMVAMIGLIGGVLGSIFAFDTCEFVSIRKKVGYYDEVLQVSAGMKYFTSIDSVFLGGSQCIAYDHENLYYTQEPPHFAKISSLSGIAFGVTSVVILWFYILTKKTTTKIWNIASAFSCIASLAQILTFQFYFSSVCKEETCSIGAGTVASFIAAMSYGCIGYEMIGNKPNKRIPHVLGEKLIKNDGDDDDHYKAPSIV